MRRFGIFFLALASALVTLSVHAIEGELAYVDDITSLTGQCYIRAIKLDPVEQSEPEEPQEPDAGQDMTPATVREGILEIAAGEHAVRVVVEGESASLWVSLAADANGPLVQVEWERLLVDGTLLANVQLQVTYSDGSTGPYRLFLMWSEFLPTVVTFCRNSYREGVVALGERAVRIGVIDADTDGRYDILEGGIVLVDADGDGDLLATGDSHERYFLDEPFNVDGITYQVASISEDGSTVVLEESEASVPPKAPLLPGFIAPGFEGPNEEGETVSLADYLGNVVLLDFWAGWCGPCISELPTLRELVDTYGDQGVTVLGINLDRSLGDFLVALADQEIDWPQIFDGSDGAIGALYRIEGIPMTYLLDADGTIVARGLRGDRLIEAVAAMLAPQETETDPSAEEPEG